MNRSTTGKQNVSPDYLKLKNNQITTIKRLKNNVVDLTHSNIASSLVSLVEWYCSSRFTQTDRFRFPSPQKDEDILHGPYCHAKVGCPPNKIIIKKNYCLNGSWNYLLQSTSYEVCCVRSGLCLAGRLPGKKTIRV